MLSNLVDLNYPVDTVFRAFMAGNLIGLMHVLLGYLWWRR